MTFGKYSGTVYVKVRDIGGASEYRRYKESLGGEIGQCTLPQDWCETDHNNEELTVKEMEWLRSLNEKVL